MSTGIKLDNGKPEMYLVPHDAVLEVAKVLTKGKQKYAAENWKNGIAWSRCISALERHLGEYKEGRRTDEESGLSHMAHVACNALFILWYEKHRPDFDDLYKQAPSQKEFMAVAKKVMQTQAPVLEALAKHESLQGTTGINIGALIGGSATGSNVGAPLSVNLPSNMPSVCGTPDGWNVK